MYDVIIIGAGPSGIMCAIQAGQNGKKVLLIERNESLGKKMLLTGGGRCNITNLKEIKDFIKSLPLENGRFLYSALNQFNPFDIYQYFENLGIALKVEKDDKVFPKSDDSRDFIIALKNELVAAHVTVKYLCEVVDIQIIDDKKIVQTKNGDFTTNNVVIATGGKSYQNTGSTGFGYAIARKFHHTLTELFPTESPVLSHDPLVVSKELQGLSFSDATLSLVDENNKIIKSHTNDLIITHFGLSGPAALKLSQFIYFYLQSHSDAKLQIDILPQTSFDELTTFLKNKRTTDPQKNFKTIIKELLPNRLVNYFFNHKSINEELKMVDVSNNQINEIVNFIKKLTIIVHDIKPIEVAFVTGGGISLKEIDPKTMESKLIPGLYFIGEVLDLHGYTGGYNLTIALSTGFTAGINIK